MILSSRSVIAGGSPRPFADHCTMPPGDDAMSSAIRCIGGVVRADRVGRCWGEPRTRVTTAASASRSAPSQPHTRRWPRYGLRGWLTARSDAIPAQPSIRAARLTHSEIGRNPRAALLGRRLS